jgi:hypothetical protein
VSAEHTARSLPASSGQHSRTTNAPDRVRSAGSGVASMPQHHAHRSRPCCACLRPPLARSPALPPLVTNAASWPGHARRHGNAHGQPLQCSLAPHHQSPQLHSSRQCTAQNPVLKQERDSVAAVPDPPSICGCGSVCACRQPSQKSTATGLARCVACM